MSSQAQIQGVFNDRVEHLNNFRRIMGDIVLDHHLISQDAEVMLLARSFDIYGDISSVAPFYAFSSKKLAIYDNESGLSFLADRNGDIVRVRGVPVVVEPYIKKVLFDKAPDMHYVQQEFSNWLVENSANYPYLVQMTMTDMPRHLNLGDRLKLGETVYEVRLVSPISRLNDSIQKVMVCPVLFSDVPVQEEVNTPFVPEVNDSYKRSKVI